MIVERQSFTNQPLGCLYLVPTPIGNLDDMSIRAVQTLQSVDLIAAEDTRNTQKLLNHFQIQTKQISFHEHNTQQRIPELLEKLNSGMNIAQVSDAGMPSISDPGKELVAACIQRQITVIPLPGPNAALTALIASGIAPQPFYFYGFLPRKLKLQQQALRQLQQVTATFILYESPYRIRKTITTLIQYLGSERQVTLARELTKIHEAFLRGTLGEVQSYLTEHQPRGEYVIIVQGYQETEQIQTISSQQLLELIQNQINSGQKPNSAIKSIAKQYQLPRQQVYNLYHGLDENK